MTPTEREELEYLGSLLLPLEDLAFALQVPMDELRQELLERKSERSLAILEGRMTRKCAVRESILDMACRGSSPAQAEALRMLKSLE